jgi:hypothetical protein
MAKRDKYKKKTKTKVVPKKRATPENPEPDVPSAVNVNPSYDAMPDEIDDPANVFKMAMLDMKKAAVTNKLAIVAQEHEKRVKAAEDARKSDLNKVKAELREVENAFRMQKEFIERKYNIALRSYTYNDETGVLKKQALPDEEDDETGKAKEQVPTVPDAEKPETLH